MGVGQVAYYGLLVAAGLASTSAVAQTGDPPTWPAEQDAVVAAPGNHKVLLENDAVRVLEVSVPPGTVEPLHSHRWPSVLYIQEAGPSVERDAAGRILFDSGTLRSRPNVPITLYRGPEAPHAIENLSKTVTMRLVRVEFKK